MLYDFVLLARHLGPTPLGIVDLLNPQRRRFKGASLKALAQTVEILLEVIAVALLVRRFSLPLALIFPGQAEGIIIKNHV